MAQITQDLFDEAKRYVKVIYQRNRNVMDAELNEAQDDLRVHFMRALRVAAGGDAAMLADGLKPVGTGAANAITIKAGFAQLGGYAFELAADHNITGLSTPGAARTDAVWAKVYEDEIDGTLDPDIVAADLGETTRRQQLIVEFGVTENSTTPPPDGDEPWLAGGFKYFLLGRIYRTAVAAISAAMVIDERVKLGNDATHGDKEVWIPASAMIPDTGDFDVGSFLGRQWQSDTIEPIDINVPLSGYLRVGDRIKSITVYGAAGNIAGEELTARLRRTETTGTDTTISTDKTSAAAGGDVNIGWTIADTDFSPTGHKVAAGCYYVTVELPNTSVAAEAKLRMVKLVFDHPPT